VTSKRNDVQTVIAYLSSLWGLTSGISLLFPLSNVLLKVVPASVFLETNARTIVTPGVLNALATITSLFSLLLVISVRREIAKSGIYKLRAWSIVGFIAAMLLLLFYIAVAHDYPLPTTSLERRTNFELFAFVAYPSVFALLTASFTALGLREFLLEENDAADAMH
jgi:hypothetical protein